MALTKQISAGGLNTQAHPAMGYPPCHWILLWYTSCWSISDPISHQRVVLLSLASDSWNIAHLSFYKHVTKQHWPSGEVFKWIGQIHVLTHSQSVQTLFSYGNLNIFLGQLCDHERRLHASMCRTIYIFNMPFKYMGHLWGNFTMPKVAWFMCVKQRQNLPHISSYLPPAIVIFKPFHLKK